LFPQKRKYLKNKGEIFKGSNFFIDLKSKNESKYLVENFFENVENKSKPPKRVK